MQLRQLEYLIALAREKHFGRAAEACYVSQPALSSGIRNLERELRVQIVQRGQRFEGFTPEGEFVLHWSQRILVEQESLHQALSGMREGLTGTLRIGAIPTALTVASLLTTPFHEQHPMVTFSLESLSSREIVDQLNDYDIDIGMTYTDGEPLGQVRVLPLYEEKYLFLTPETAELRSRNAITWSEAAEHPLCLLSPVMQNRRIIDGHFAEHGVAVKPVIETDAVSAIYAHVSAMGLSTVIPHAWLSNFRVPAGARLLTLPRPRRRVHVGLVLPAHDVGSLLVRTFLNTVAKLEIAKVLDASTAAHSPR